MSAINLTLDQLKSISSEIQGYDNALLSNYLPDVASELQAITSNVQGEELHSIVNTITTHFDSVKQVLSQALPKLEEFIDTQMKTYEQTEEQVAEELRAVLNKMAMVTQGGGGLINPATQRVMDGVNNLLGKTNDAMQSVFGGKDKTLGEKVGDRLDGFLKKTETSKEIKNGKSWSEMNWWERTSSRMSDNFNYKGKEAWDVISGTGAGIVNTVFDAGAVAIDGIYSAGDAIIDGIQGGANWILDKTGIR